MKKIILITTLFICCLQCDILLVQSQILYGVTEYGGSSDAGVIFSFDPTSSTFTKLKDFAGTDGFYPNSLLMQASNGKLYGATYRGGNSGWGVIFSFDPTSSVYTKLKDFSGAIGTNSPAPVCPIQASDGKLYGMTGGGGIFGFGDGTIYSLDPATSTYTKLKDFDGINDGSNPLGRFIQASDGKLYGMTYKGGSNYGGVIFSFDPTSSTFTKLRDFNSTDGAEPFGSLIQATDGKLYGVTSNADIRPYGVLFSYDPISSTYTMLKDFNDNISGNGPYGSLIQASDGKLYGTTAYGGSNDSGVIFSYDLTSSTYKKLWDFQSTTGTAPHGSLMQASDGKLYGMTRSGGSNYRGVIFSFDPATGTYTKLRDFLGTDGAYPSWGSALIEVTQSSTSSESITGFTLVNADTEEDIQPLPDGSVIYLNSLPTTKLNIRANTKPGKVGSVVFMLDGQKVRTENGAPYAFAGDLPSGDYHAMPLPFGSHTLTATPYSNYNGAGVQGTPLTINFTIPVLVESATLINAETDKDIQNLTDGSIIALNVLPTDQFNIRANTSPVKVDSVQFYLDGSKVRTEMFLPYAFAGDKGGVDYLPMTFSLGYHDITAIPYASYNGIGFQGRHEFIYFYVTDQALLCNGVPYDPQIQECTSCGVIDPNLLRCTPCGLIENYEGCTPCGIVNYSYEEYCCDVDSTKYYYGGSDCTPCGVIDLTTEKCTPCGIIPLDQVCDQTGTRAPIHPDMTEGPLGIKLSPNPVHNTLLLTMNGQNKRSELFILSESGMVIKKIRAANTNQVSIDVSSLANGIYFIKVISGDKVTYRQFMKM